VVFDKQTRDGEKKKFNVMTPSDRGPKGDMPAMHVDCPDLPPRLSKSLKPYDDPVSQMPGAVQSPS